MYGTIRYEARGPLTEENGGIMVKVRFERTELIHLMALEKDPTAPAFFEIELESIQFELDKVLLPDGTIIASYNVYWLYEPDDSMWTDIIITAM